MSEYTEQKEVIRWFKDIYPQYSMSIRLSMNGVPKGKGQAAAIRNKIARTQGMVDDESDLFFAVPQNHIGGFCGLFIEMKDFGKKPTEGQLEYLEYQLSMGYAAEWCEGSEAAKRVIREYMEGRDNE